MKGPLGLVDWEKIRMETMASIPYMIGARTSYTIQSAMNQVVTERLSRKVPEILSAQKKLGWRKE